jgi:hypothetical protein
MIGGIKGSMTTTSIFSANLFAHLFVKGWCLLMTVEAIDQRKIQQKMPPRQAQKIMLWNAMHLVTGKKFAFSCPRIAMVAVGGLSD